MLKPTKFFRVAVEGGTSDGREIKREWLEQMAATYKPETYAARINCEHIRGFSPDKPFFSYGDVTALKTEEVTLEIGGKNETRLALLAQIAPNAEFARINKADQKVFTSIEVNSNFAGTGQAYLVGLACTDSPASLGTERLEFAAKVSNNVYSTALETRIEVDEAPTSEANALVAGFKALVAAFGAKEAPATPPVLPPAPAPTPANDNAQLSAITAALAALPGTLEAMAASQAAATAKVSTDLAALTAKLASTDADPARKPAPGAKGAFTATDC